MFTLNNQKIIKFRNTFLFYALLSTLSLFLLSAFLLISDVNRNYRATFEGMLFGSAYKPFVNRILVSWLTLGTKALIPTRLLDNLEVLVGSNRILSNIVQYYGVPKSLRIEAIINLIWQFFSLFGFLFCFSRLAQITFSLPRRALVFFITLASLGLLPFFKYGYIYDLPELFLCTLAIYAIVSKKPFLYFISFILADLNKESSIVLIIPSILLFWNYSKPNLTKVLMRLILQISLFILIRIPISYYFRNNPGVLYENHFIDHLQYFYKDTLSAILGLVGFIIIGFLLTYKLKKKPVIITLGLFSGILLFCLFLFGGYPFEIRVFYEIFGIMILSIGWSFLDIRNYSIDVKTQTTEQFLESAHSLMVHR